MSTTITTGVDNIVQRLDDGFYQTSTATKAEGWPIDTNNWCHLISQTHTNGDNYYAMQIAGGFFENENFYIRKTAGAGNQPWNELVHSGNLKTFAQVNVRSYGARIDGITNDGPAFTAARDAAAGNGIIDVPAGPFYVTTGIGGADARPKLWRMSGNTYGGGGQPVISMKDGDTVETFFDGVKYFGKDGSAWQQTPTLRVDGVFRHQATPGELADNYNGVLSTLQSYTTIERCNPGRFLFASNHELKCSAWGDGQFAALSGVAHRPHDALDDGKGRRSPIWGAYAEGTDNTGRPANESGIVHGMEINLGSNNGDPNDERIILLLSAGRANKSGPNSSNADVGVGLSVGGAVGEVQIGTLLKPQGDFYKAGLSFAAANPVDRGAGAPPTIQLARGQYITFDVGNGYTLREIPDAIGNGMMQWRFVGAETFRLDAYGNTSQPGRAAFGYFNMQSRQAPTSSADPMGEYGDTLISGGHLYHKTSSGWYRVQMDSF